METEVAELAVTYTSAGVLVVTRDHGDFFHEGAGYYFDLNDTYNFFEVYDGSGELVAMYPVHNVVAISVIDKYIENLEEDIEDVA
jgi:hypothetical protein